MAPPNREAIWKVASMTFGLLGGGAVGFWMQASPVRTYTRFLHRALDLLHTHMLTQEGDEQCPMHDIRVLLGQTKMMVEERAARAIRMRSRLDRLKVPQTSHSCCTLMFVIQ